MNILLFSWLLGAFIFCFKVQRTTPKVQGSEGWSGAIALIIISLLCWPVFIPLISSRK